MGRAALDADLMASIVDLARVTGGAAEADPISLPAAVESLVELELPLREADRQAVGIVCRVRRIDEKPEPAHVAWRGEQFLAFRLLEREQPVIGDEDGPLAEIVPPVGGIRGPALFEIAERAVIRRVARRIIGRIGSIGHGRIAEESRRKAEKSDKGDWCALHVVASPFNKVLTFDLRLGPDPSTIPG